jgi:YkoY family integral membrane protein
MNTLLQEILNEPLASLLIIGNLILIESLLSVDNAAVLATMVLKLPAQQRKKALKYGIIGAYVFRGICLLLASYLIRIWWLKSLGGFYLLFLAIDWWLKKKKSKKAQEEEVLKKENTLYKMTVGKVGKFWATVISVELMDIAFSLDNVFAAVAFSDNILIILMGVFIGILAMRFVAQYFVELIEKYPFLEGCAFAVIGLLGVKLALSLYEHYYEHAPLSVLLKSEAADWVTSALTLGIFFIPVVTCSLFNFPKKHV